MSLASSPRRCAARSRILLIKAGRPSGNESNAVMSSTKPNLAAKRADEILDFLGIMRERRHYPPDPPRPGDVARAARDHVHLQLRHQIAESCDIELVAFGDLFKRAGDAADLGHQLRLLDL